MSSFSLVEKQVLTQLQRGIKPVSQPFAGFDLPEAEVVALLERAKTDALLRRFGGVFDARRLGYKSILCALDVPDDLLEEKAAIIAAHPGVTHCYERRPIDCRAGMVELARPSRRAAGRSATVSALQKETRYPTLWFTLAVLHDEFDVEIASLHAALDRRHATLYELPAIRRFKIDVVFDLHTRNRDERVPGRAPEMTDDDSFRVFTDDEKELVRALDQQLPLVARPFAAVAEQIGRSEEFVLSTLQAWKEQGVLRRIGAILYHRQVGFKANAMCVWPVDGDMLEAGRRVAARPEVTHCYQRPRLDAFPFDLYAMIHTASWEETEALFNEISAGCGLENGKLFASGREFKKSSMQYFREK